MREFIKSIGTILPEIPKPEKKPGLNERFVWTGLALIAYLIMATTPLYGLGGSSRQEDQLAFLRVVFASTSSVYGNAEAYPTPEDARPRPVSPYGVTKLSCEHLAQTYAECFELDVVRLRYFTVYGPRQRPDMAFSRIIAALADGTPFPLFGTGAQSRDFTYVKDAVAGTMAAMRRGPSGRVYNIGGGTEATMREAIELCERLDGRRLDVREQPQATGDVRRTSADTSLIREELGWQPRTSLAEGLVAQIENSRTRADNVSTDPRITARVD